MLQWIHGSLLQTSAPENHPIISRQFTRVFLSLAAYQIDKRIITVRHGYFFRNNSSDNVFFVPKAWLSTSARECNGLYVGENRR